MLPFCRLKLCLARSKLTNSVTFECINLNLLKFNNQILANTRVSIKTTSNYECEVHSRLVRQTLESSDKLCKQPRFTTVMIKLRSLLSGLQRLRRFSQFVKLDKSNYFKVFDFKSEFSLDEERLAKAFKSMQMLYHPDKTARLDQVRRLRDCSHNQLKIWSMN